MLRAVLLLALTASGYGFLSVPSPFSTLPRPGTNSATSLNLRMGAGGDADVMRRRDMLKRAGFAVVPLISALSAEPASAQFMDARGDRPGGLGPVAGGRYLSLCDSENCVSTSEDVYSKRYLPPWTYNDEGKKSKNAAQAMEELASVIKDYKGAKIIKQADNYLYAEFERDFAFVDDVEFLFSPNGQTVEYRSAARKAKKSDHRSRIKALRVKLQEKGWRSVGYRCKSYTYNSLGDMLCSDKDAPTTVERQADLM